MSLSVTRCSLCYALNRSQVGFLFGALNYVVGFYLNNQESAYQQKYTKKFTHQVHSYWSGNIENFVILGILSITWKQSLNHIVYPEQKFVAKCYYFSTTRYFLLLMLSFILHALIT